MIKDKYTGKFTKGIRYYHRHRVESLKYQRNHLEQCSRNACLSLHKLRMKAMETLGNKCIRCGESDYRCLQFDHINGNGTKEHLLNSRSKFLHSILNGRSDIQLLCANCNWKKKYEKKEDTHKC